MILKILSIPNHNLSDRLIAHDYHKKLRNYFCKVMALIQRFFFAALVYGPFQRELINSAAKDDIKKYSHCSDIVLEEQCKILGLPATDRTKIKAIWSLHEHSINDSQEEIPSENINWHMYQIAKKFSNCFKEATKQVKESLDTQSFLERNSSSQNISQKLLAMLSNYSSRCELQHHDCEINIKFNALSQMVL